MNLTERKIKYLEPGKSRQIVWDNGGFGLQVTPDGEKSYVLEYRFNEMTKLIALGIYPDMSLDTARRQAVMAMAMVMQGKDPEKGLPAPEKSKADVPVSKTPTFDQTPEKSKAYVPASQMPTFDQIREKASEKLDQIKGKASEQIEKIKASDTLSQFKEKAAAKLDEIKQRVEKKVTHPQLKSQPAENKIIPLDKNARAQQEKSKSAEKKAKVPVKKAEQASLKDTFDRVLDKSELKTLWLGLENSDMPPAHQLAVKLLIITAQRYEEVIPSRWADYDLGSKWWTIPEDLTKNGKKHKVPLANLALDLLRKIKELSGMSGVLFPAPGGMTPIDSKTLAEGLQRAQVRFGLKPFTLQDLQNSAVCQMLDNGIPESTLYQLLNQDESAEFGKKIKKAKDSDLRKALEKLERQLPKSY
jgi:integrase